MTDESELIPSAIGLTIAALRQDPKALATLLDGLSDDELRLVARESFRALADAVHAAIHPIHVRNMIIGLQKAALEEQDRI